MKEVFLTIFYLFSPLLLIGCFALWGLFVFFICSIIHKFGSLLIYYFNYFYARFFYKKNPYATQKELEKMENKLEEMSQKEFKVYLCLYFRQPITFNYDAAEHETLVLKHSAYKKGIQSRKQ